MGILDKAMDKLKGLEYEQISYEQMVCLVRDNFIKGADDAFLKKIKKTAKGGSFRFGIRTLYSKDERFRLIVDPGMGSFMIWIMGKDVSLIDEVDKKEYMIRSRQWKKFYKLVLRTIEDEKLNRTR